MALRMIRGSLDDHYKKVPSYLAELRRVDHDGFFDIQVDRSNPDAACLFKRMYIGFSGLRLGFLRGCRPIISLDGCFLKTPLGGQLLSTIGQDGNIRYSQSQGL